MGNALHLGRSARRVLIAALVLAALAPAARVTAADLMTIHGTVKDKIGRPLSNVAVSDGNHVVYTNASGAYSIGEQTPGTYQITVSRLGLDPLPPRSVGVVDAVQAVDFVATYVLGVAYSAPAFNSSQVPTETITVTTYAPSSSSCVSWTDSSSNSTVALALTSTNVDGSSVWQGSFPVAALPEATYATVSSAKDCVGGQLITLVRASSYIVDNTAPTIDPAGIIPVAGGNTTGTQPLVARLADTGGSGVNGSATAFTLIDDTTAAETSVAGASYNPTTQLARTSPVILAQRHLFRLRISGADRAGNVASFEQTDSFLATRIVLPSADSAKPKGSIPPTSCTVGSQVDTATLTKQATCQNVPLHLSSTTVTVGGSRRSALGVLRETVSLANAVMSTTVAGQTLSQPAGGTGAAWAPKNIDVAYSAAATTSDQVASVPQFNQTLGAMTTRVPAAWSTASLSMQPTTATVAAPICSDPSTETGCHVDPVPDPTLTLWNPTVPEHVNVCDAAVTHKERLAAAPGTALSIVASVDTSKLNPTSATLLYSAAGGAQQTQTVNTPGASTFSFSIPSSAMNAGDTVRYAISVAGTFAGSTCASFTTAVVPSNHSFATVATNVIDQDNDPLFATALEAGRSAASQPGFTPQTSATSLCNSFFVSPTPCDIYVNTSAPEASAANSSAIEGIDAGQFAAARQASAAATTGQCRSATIYPADGYDYHALGPKGGNNGGSFLGRHQEQQDVTDYNRVSQHLEAGQSYYPGSASSFGKVASGLSFVITGSPGTHPYRIEVVWKTAGESRSFTGPAYTSGVGNADGNVAPPTVEKEMMTNGRHGDPSVVWTGSGASSHYSGTVAASQQTRSEGSGWRTSTWDVVYLDAGVGTAYTFLLRLSASANLSIDSFAGANVYSNFKNDGNDWWLRATSLTITSLDPNYYFTC